MSRVTVRLYMYDRPDEVYDEYLSDGVVPREGEIVIMPDNLMFKVLKVTHIVCEVKCLDCRDNLVQEVSLMVSLVGKHKE
jgi:hypothetical protein